MFLKSDVVSGLAAAPVVETEEAAGDVGCAEDFVATAAPEEGAVPCFLQRGDLLLQVLVLRLHLLVFLLQRGDGLFEFLQPLVRLTIRGQSLCTAIGK